MYLSLPIAKHFIRRTCQQISSWTHPRTVLVAELVNILPRICRNLHHFCRAWYGPHNPHSYNEFQAGCDDEYNEDGSFKDQSDGSFIKSVVLLGFGRDRMTHGTSISPTQDMSHLSNQTHIDT